MLHREGLPIVVCDKQRPRMACRCQVNRAYALTDHLVHSDPVVHLFERWARAKLARGFSLDSAAKAVGTSKRTLTRQLQSVLGKSPMPYFQSLRVEQAVHLLKTTPANVEEVAAKVGYKDGGTLRLLLRRRLNLGLNEIRKLPEHKDEHPRHSGDASVAGHTIGLPAALVLFVFLSCVGLTYPNGAALGLAPSSRDTGRAMSAILLFTFAKRSSTIRP